MLVAAAFLAFALTFFVSATPVSPPRPRIRQDAGRYLTTGIQTSNNGRPHIRHEIRDLKDNFTDHWNLYLLGLQAFQQMDENDFLSFYQIAGIHGRPFRVWQDAQGVPNGGGTGYCPHSNRLFFGWHRSYLALYEQELYKHILAIVDQAPANRSHWISVADSFRIPYWDWALGDNGGEIPDFFTRPFIQATDPSGNRRTIANPLFNFQFHPVDPGFADKWAKMNATIRWPTSDDATAQSQPQKWRAHFLGRRRSFHDDVGRAFDTGMDFNYFSEKIEEVHGSIHGNVGGSDPPGTMWPVEYSAFDPMFMLHHANVDRLHALYQAVHADRWIEPSNVRNSGNFWIPNNATVDAAWQLQPFWKDSRTFYSSNDIRDTAVFNYAYPETQPWNYASEADWQAAVNASISQLYSPSVRSILKGGTAASGTDLARVLRDETFMDWTITTKASSLDMPSTFRIVFSLDGDPPSSNGTHVGEWTKVGPSKHDSQDWKARLADRKTKGLKPADQDMDGAVSLTSSLLDQIIAGKLGSLDPIDIVPYLRLHLTWQMFAGVVQSPVTDENINVIDVNVVSSRVRIPKDPTVPLEYCEEATSYPEITQGRRGIPDTSA